MEWALWGGSAIFALTVGGMFFMRNRPLRDAQGNVVNEFGRPIDELSNEANVVLIALYNSVEPLSGYDLRRHVTMSRQSFYAMIADLEFKELLNSSIEKLGAHNIRMYRLTEHGISMFEDDNRAA